MTWILIGAAIGCVVGAAVGLIRERRDGSRPDWGAFIGIGLAGAAVGALAGNFLGARFEPGMAFYNRLPDVQTTEAFQRQVLAAERPVLVDFYSPSCLACRRLAPTLGRLAEEYRHGIDVIKVDGKASPDLLRPYGVEYYPTLILFVGGKAHGRKLQGLPQEADIRRLLDGALSPSAGRPSQKAPAG